ncbi:aspartyl/asparaginyl beta-hydroxylase domain-containing protein [Sphingomonas flavalba]|uniref:aspartyl/asparaginyl beta-hydroxylase domain-containing protein n=1 Tax=Sphingomonas flavalba TaxID=2559804 RepID=UPI00109DBCD6|nr:aspartyl/asparaginyl beta-hydroxylase domain-containing protein [Sphingomonas flavalba]
MTQAEINALLVEGASAQRRGDHDKAKNQYRAVLDRGGEHPAALNALGIIALGEGDVVAAGHYFERAIATDDKAPELWLNLAKARRLANDNAAEERCLERALAMDQRNFMANVRMAELHERSGDLGRAMFRWSGVLALAEGMERRDAALEKLLDHARSFATGYSERLADILSGRLEDSRKAVLDADRRRFDACVDRILGRRRIYVNECHGLHYPFLPADEFFDRRHFPWMEAFESHADAIREEFVALLDAGLPGARPYVQMEAGAPRNKWSALDRSERWSAWFLWHHGVRQAVAAERCAKTLAALEAVPLSDLPGRSPTAFFSILHPHTRIPPHTGVTNARAIVHLPLIVPPGCGFRVGGETRAWEAGVAFAFDDTIEHEAWNDSDEPRAVLIFDVWNPHIVEAERALLRALFQALRDSELSPYADADVG